MTEAGAPGPLVDLVRNHYDAVLEIRLEEYKPNAYRPTGCSVAVQKVEERRRLSTVEVPDDEKDESPEEIAAAVYDLALERAQAEGTNRFRASLIGTRRNGTVDKLDTCTFSTGTDPETGTVQSLDAGPVDILDHALTMTKHTHERHMKTCDKLESVLDKTVDLVGKVAEFTGPMAQAQVELKRIDLEQEEARFESEDRQHMWGVSRDVLLKLMSVFGVQIADAWKAAGFPGAPPKPPDEQTSSAEQIDSLVSRWDRMFAQIGPDKLQKLSDLMGEDLAKLAEKMRTAKDDGMFRNMAKELAERAQKEPDWPKRLAEIMQTLGGSLGNQFASILGDAAR